jgi:hypothetical protein
LQKFEFLSLKQSQSNISRPTTTSPVRRRRAGARVVPPWCPGRRSALLGWLHCPRPHSPKPRTVPRPPRSPPSSRCAPAGRTSAQRTAGRFHASPAVHSCRGRRMHLETSPSIFWSQAGTLVTHKRAAALLIPCRATPRSMLRPCPPPAAATARSGADPPLSQLRCFPPLSHLAVARRRTRLSHRAATSPAQRSWWPPPLVDRAPLAGPLPAPIKHRNQPPGTRGSFPTRARPVWAAGAPEFGRTAGGWRPGTQLKAPNSLQGLNRESRAYW